MNRLRLRILLFFLYSVFWVAPTHAVVDPTSPKSPETPKRILVKWKPAALAEIESSFSPNTTTLTRANFSKNSSFNPLLQQLKVQRIKPIYSDIVQEKRSKRRSVRSIARAIQSKHPLRVARFEGTSNPPDLSAWYSLELDSNQSVEEKIQLLRQDGRVESVQPVRYMKAQYTPSDYYWGRRGSWGQAFDDLWGLKDDKLKMSSAWDSSKGDNMVVAVIDTGLGDGILTASPNSPYADLKSNLWTNPGEVPGDGIDNDQNGFTDDIIGWNFVGPSAFTPTPNNNPIDKSGHGTHVAGTIAASSDSGGIIGVAFKSKIMTIRVLDDQGYGPEDEIAQGVLYATRMGASVINMSLGGTEESPLIHDAIQFAYQQGVVIVVAAGNSNADAYGFFPAAFSEVITVAASDAADKKASFSNFGNKIDVSAPGVGILSLNVPGSGIATAYPSRVVNGNYLQIDGTSMASPHVAGLAALLLSAHPTYTHEQIRQIIRGSADDLGAPGFDPVFGYGRINAERALNWSGVPMEVHLSSPIAGATLVNSTSIRGFVRGPGLMDWKVEYGMGQTPASWTLLQQGNQPVQNGEFVQLDPVQFVNGSGIIRLTARTATQIYIDQIPVKLAGIQFTYPPTPRDPTLSLFVRHGEQIIVQGIARAPNFARYEIDWLPGILASGVGSSAGITLRQNGIVQVAAGPLADWNTAQLPSNGYYTLRLKIYQTNNSVSEAKTVIYVEKDVWSGWPQQVSEVRIPPSISVLKKSTGENMLAVTALQRFHEYSLDGTKAVTVPTKLQSMNRVGVGRWNGVDRAVVLSGYNAQTIDAVGNVQNSISMNGGNYFFNQTPPVITDLDNDGSSEILGVAFSFTDSFGKIYAFTSAGNLLPNFSPILIPRTAYTSEWNNRFICVDLNGDGIKEIIVMEDLAPKQLRIKAYDRFGQPFAWTTRDFAYTYGSLMAGDLDGDKQPELVVTLYQESTSPATGQIIAIKRDGNVLTGWENISFSGMNDLPRVAMGDLTGDGKAEVVFAAGRQISIYQSSGQALSGWPKAILYTPRDVVIGDLDGDQRAEVVVTGVRAYVNELPDPLSPYFSDSLMIAYHTSGNIYREWHMTGRGDQLPAIDPNPFIGDLNGDGKVDLAVIYGLMQMDPSNGFYRFWDAMVQIYQLPGTYRSDATPWPATFQNLANTSVQLGNTPVLPAPATPGNGQIVSVTTSTITASWAAPSGNVTQYNLAASTISQPSAFVKTISLSSLSGTLSQLLPSTTYSIYINACNTTGCSAYGLIGSTKTLTPVATTSPGMPGLGPIQAISSTTIRVAWTAPPEVVTSYDVMLSKLNSVQVPDITKTVTGLTADVNPLLPSTSYGAFVRACNSLGCSAYNFFGSVTTKAADAPPPPPPSNQPPTVGLITATELSPKTVELKVTATDDGGEGVLTYSWNAEQPISPVDFQPNHSNPSKTTVATLGKVGNYLIKVTVRDASGATSTQTKSITIDPVVNEIVLTPASVTISSLDTQLFTASFKDQFGMGFTNATVQTWEAPATGILELPADATLSHRARVFRPKDAGGPLPVRAKIGQVIGVANITVNGVTAPPRKPMPPQLPIDSLRITPQTVLTLKLSLDPIASYDWQFIPNRTTSGKPVSVRTTSRSLNLSEVGLPGGEYELSIIANGTNGLSSDPFKTNLEMVAVGYSNVRVYPNPWRANLHAAKDVVFDGLTPKTEVTILNVAGQKVAEVSEVNGTARWNLTTESGDPAASGIYLYVLSDQTQTTRGKFVVIR